MSKMSFAVYGEPVPQGSMSVFNGHVVHRSGPALRAYRESIRIGFLIASGSLDAVMDAGVSLQLTFLLAPKKSHLRANGSRKPDAPLWPLRPDIDKLARAVLDALTGTAYNDDSQVVRLDAGKFWLPDRDQESRTLIDVEWV